MKWIKNKKRGKRMVKLYGHEKDSWNSVKILKGGNIGKKNFKKNCKSDLIFYKFTFENNF